MASVIFSAHGNAVTVAEPPGPDSLENVGDYSWTDVVGLRQGRGSTFRGREGRSLWFHLPIPTPVRLWDAYFVLLEASVNARTEGDVAFDAMHVRDDNEERLINREGFHESAYIRAEAHPPPVVNGALSISVRATFTRAANVTILGGRIVLNELARPV